jgi:hypothetical protein
MSYKTHIKDIYTDIKKSKKYKTIKTRYFKKKIKIFSKKNTMYINNNLKHIFRNCTVKEWLIISKKIEKIIKTDDFKINTSHILSSLILSFTLPTNKFLISSYYHYSTRRIPRIKSKFMDINFLIKSLILNNDKDKEHLDSLKYKLNRIGTSSFKFVLKKKLTKIENNQQIDEQSIDKEIKDTLKHYIHINRNKRNFKIYKIREDFIYDAFILFFLDLRKYELDDILFYKQNLNYFDYDYEVFVLKEKSSP